MPYISQKARQRIFPHLEIFWKECHISEPGEMNYIITQLLEYYREGKYKYKFFNEIVGILSCILHEYYRRMISVYEDQKKEENGDVFHF